MTDAATPTGYRPGGAQTHPDDEISLWEVFAVLLRRRRTIIWTTFLVTLLALLVTLLRDRTYTTAAAFRPQGSEVSQSQLLALASQFGVNVPGGGSEEASPAFYAELLTSREIVAQPAAAVYDVAGVGPSLLKDLLEIEEDTEPLRDERVMEWLVEDAISVSTGRETGTVTITVRTEWPDLSQAIASDLLDAVSNFNLTTRQSQAATERAFVEARVRAAEAELSATEDALRAFLEANRDFGNSPMLQFQHEGLMRDVSLRQSVLTTLVQSYEQARISEVRDTPVITVLQAPYLPPGPDERRFVIVVALGIVMGGVMGVVLAFLVEAFRNPGKGDPAREDFQRAWDALVGSIPFVGGRRKQA